MKTISNSVLFFSLFFIIGCDEDETPPTYLGPIYTIDDMAGIWEMDSHTMDISMTMDIAGIISYGLDSTACVSIGGTYSNGMCTVSDIMLAALTETTCMQLNGEVTNTSLCSVTQTETLCCEGSNSSTFTIASDGSLTMVANYGEVQENTGSISINGTSITMTLINPSMTPSTMTLTGTLSISEDTATLSFLDNSYEDVFSETADGDFPAGTVTGTVTYIMIMTKAAITS